MHVILGVIVLVLGVGILGWWGTTHNAVDMEADITERAGSALGQTTHPVDLRVFGRDVTVTGRANSEAERDAIVDRLNALDGRRVVHDELDLLKVASPYVFKSQKSADGQSFAGNTPTEGQRSTWAGSLGDAAAGFDLAAGMPDAQWPSVVDKGLAGLALLKNGELNVSDRDVRITGLAGLPAQREAALNAIGDLPEGYSLTSDIQIEDDGTPMRLTVRRDEAGATAVGKFPADMDPAIVAGALGLDATEGDINVAQVAAPYADWNTTVDTGLGALAKLSTGTLAIADRDVSLTGTATRADRDAAIEMMSGISGDYSVSTDIGFVDDGQPFNLMAVRGAEGNTISGKVPFGMANTDLAGVAGFDATSDVQVAEIEADGMNWPAVSGLGLSALGKLQTGNLSVTDNAVNLSGVGSRAQIDAAKTLLAGMPEGVAVTEDLNIFDDGKAFGLVAAKAANGNSLSGKLPYAMKDTDLAALAGFEAQSDVQVADIDADGMDWSLASGAGLGALGALDSGELSVAEGSISLRGVGTRAGIAAAKESLAKAPEGVSVSEDLAIADDGQPMSLMVDNTSGQPVASGKLPFGFGDAEVDTAFGSDVDTNGVTFAEIEDPAFADRANNGLMALSKLQRGSLTLGSDTTKLTGTAITPTGMAAAMAALGDGAAEMASIEVIDDGAPFVLNAQRRGGMTTVTGKSPAELSAAAIEGLATGNATVGADVSALSGPDFAIRASSGLKALDALKDGMLTVTEDAVELTGAGTREGVAAAEAELANITDVNVTKSLSFADDGAPFSLEASYDGKQVLSAGKLPFGMDTDIAASVLGVESPSSLTRNADIESADGQWPGFASTGLIALKGLNSGQLSVTGSEMTLTGVGTRAAKSAAQDALATVPAGYTATSDISIFDDGEALMLNATRGESTIASGKLPFGLSDTYLSGAYGGDLDTSAVKRGELTNGAFARRTSAGLAALAGLETGELTVTEGKTMLTGMATNPAARSKAIAPLAGLDDVVTDIDVLDDGRPFAMRVDYDGQVAVGSGKVPAEMSADVVSGAFEVNSDVDLTVSRNGDAGFDAKARAGLASLAMLERGYMQIENNLLTVRGDARTPAEKAKAEEALGGLGDVVAINALDDGKAPRFTADYRKGASATLIGKLPEGVSASDVAGSLGLASFDSSATEGMMDTDQPVLDQLGKLASAVPQVDYLIFTGGDIDPQIEMGASEGVDYNALKAGVLADFPTAIVNPAPERAPQNGDRRVNDETGQDEEYRDGAWRTVFGFSPTPDACRAATTDLLADNQVNFVTSKADLDPSSAQSIARLAGLIDFCIRETNLKLEVAGHTDSVGSESSNQSLSEARANAVRDALLARGLPADRMVATGYGEAQPIADNDTDEGRAANRRTEINWSE